MIGDAHPHRTTEGRQHTDLSDRSVSVALTSEEFRYVAEIEARADARDRADAAALWVERNSEGVVGVEEITRYGSELLEYELTLYLPNHADHEAAEHILNQGKWKALRDWE